MRRTLVRQSLRLVVLAAWFMAPATSARCHDGFRLPAEFERQDAIWMAWPTFQYTSERPSLPVVTKMLRALAPHVRVNLLVNSDQTGTEALAHLARHGVRTDRITPMVIPYVDIWLRDMGPIFLVDGEGTKRVVDFGFNGWGLPDEYYSPEDLAVEEAVDRTIGEALGVDVVSTALTSEGGNREVNGRGTMIAIEKTERQRNPGWSREAIEAELARALEIRKVIWLEQGVVEDSPPTAGLRPGPTGEMDAYTDGVEHVDEVARFVNARTILLAEVTAEEAGRDPIAALNRTRLERSAEILRAARDQDGRAFRILRMPSAETIYEIIDPDDGVYQWLSGVTLDDGTVFPSPDPVPLVAAAGYMNFVVSNGVVLVAKYWRPGLPEVVRKKDARAVTVLRAAFPGREVVALDALAINLGGGGMHCITQQEPARR